MVIPLPPLQTGYYSHMFKHRGGMNHGKPPRLGVAQKEAPKRHKNMGFPWLISG